ncbi:MAG: 5'-methylthioadenosine/adenosylhomocysteine nucleosidase [Defluviitaleaceae bacterium]|nr:5'-methylthioadenosine/adenosylhomocysteine nucleosidase [Defluviitaleaceae bacterium]
MIGIIGAMEVEIRNILDKMENIKTKNIGNVDYYQGELGGRSVLVALCRVGKVNAAHATSIMIANFDVTGIINVGVAGGISADVGIGDVVVSSDLVQHDVDATTFGYALGHVPSLDDAFFAADGALVNATKKAGENVLAKYGRKLHIGRIATGDQFIASPIDKVMIEGNFGALAVEMEGAAIAQVCTLTNTPFVVIRAISDKADGTAHEDFPAFVDETAQISAAIVMDMVSNL